MVFLIDSREMSRDTLFVGVVLTKSVWGVFTDKEKKRLSMPRKVVEEFLATGFAENAYDATVSLLCEPRAVPPEYIQIIVDLKDLVIKQKR